MDNRAMEEQHSLRPGGVRATGRSQAEWVRRDETQGAWWIPGRGSTVAEARGSWALHNRWALGAAKSVMKVGFPSKQVVRPICMQVTCWGKAELEGAAVESQANPPKDGPRRCLN